ncbi:MAG TPA: cysteine-rich CWC family protein [Burkholderiales bacterium]|nr:cysteine-rich CWC family protein [Burkholderiales bacterium]
MTSPLRTLRCPLCGAPNQCVPASTGSFDTPCWCTHVKISPETLARIPADPRGLACLCPRCAKGKDA